MKRILLLGDSIRIGYQEYVKAALNGLAEVVFPLENGRFSKYTLWGIHPWIRELGTPDIVHWNNGIWDTQHDSPMEDALTGLSEYETNLRRIINELRRYTNHIIFATTTYPSDRNGNWRIPEIAAYNELATSVMQENAIEINDLNRLITPDDICGDLLHLNEDGYRRAGLQTAQLLKQYL